MQKLEKDLEKDLEIIQKYVNERRMVFGVIRSMLTICFVKFAFVFRSCLFWGPETRFVIHR